jgi:hypothetical protein
LASNSRLTFNVALEGNTAVLGTNFGVYVFDRTGSTWQQTQKITPPVAGGVFATSLVLRGSSLLIGDTGVVGGPGHLYLYVKSNGFWILGPTLETGEFIQPDGFGAAVGIVQDTVVVGAPTLSVFGTPVSLVGGGVYAYTCTL